jgi:hypothetical protein
LFDFNLLKSNFVVESAKSPILGFYFFLHFNLEFDWVFNLFKVLVTRLNCDAYVIPSSFDMLTDIILTLLDTGNHLGLYWRFMHCHPGVVLKSFRSLRRCCNWSSCKSTFCWIRRGWSLLFCKCCLLFD